MALLKTAEEFQKYIRIPGSVSVDSFLPSVQDAQDKYFPAILGNKLLNDLDAWYNLTEQPTVTAFTKLLPHVQRALARFTLFVASAEFDVTISESGIGVINQGGIVPASSDRVERFNDSNEERAWSNIETLLVFLEKNKSDYPEWVESTAYTMAIRNMVNSAEEFNLLSGINHSRLAFYGMRSKMDDVDNLKIKPVISEALFNRIISEIKANTFTDPIKKIMDPLKRAEVFFTLVENIDIKKYQGQGVDINKQILQRDIDSNTTKANAYIGDVRNILNANPSLYPEYMNSEQYDDMGEPDLYKNTKEAPNFHFR